MSALLHVDNISKHFGGFVALDGIDLEVQPGERLGLIGPNGSGKSTLVNCICGTLKNETGTVSFDGHVQGPVDTAGRDIRTDVDARRAVDAVHQLVPFADTYRGLTYTVRFDAKKACAAKN